MSVLIRSHNDAAYVRRAVVSAFRQRAEFGVEIVVADDASDDGTLPILSELVELGRGVISLVRRAERVGYAQNFFQTLEACRGRYIAVLDADDFWCRPDKLARQHHLLESNQGLSAAGHRYLRVTGGASDERFGHASARQSSPITAMSFYKGAWVKNSTIMIRADCLSTVPDWVKSTPSEDIAVQALCLQHGDIGFLNEIMAVCQISGEGVVSSLGTAERLEWSVSSWQIIRRHAPPGLRQICEASLAVKCFDLADALQADGRDEAAARYRTAGTELGGDRWPRRLKSALRGTVVHSVVGRLRAATTLRPIPQLDEWARVD